jgi:hypothetical protein
MQRSVDEHMDSDFYEEFLNIVLVSPEDEDS